MLSTHTERPRELKWYHAGPMLYGDWGTSRFYVLGLAFYYSLHASFWYVMGVGLIVAAVGWAYTIICRCYPDGGGVYSAARHTSRQLAVIGALLLFADYIVTASISALDGMHYLNIPGPLVPVCAMGAILLIGFINYVGPRKAGTFALIVAVATLILTVIIVLFSIPHLREGWHNITPFSHVPGTALHKWDNLVKVILALSGVEAIANMTGIMVPPVSRTSKKAIWPVLIEVVVFNLILAVAMCALTNTGSTPAADYDAKVAAYQEQQRSRDPHWEANATDHAAIAALQPSPEQMQRDDDIKNKVLRVIANDFVNPWFAGICGVVFAFLLFSAVNTAVADMVSIQYVMSRDTELPHFFTRLNTFGVPWLALLPAIFLPILILSMFQDLEALGDLYAIGVVGAIGINLGSCCINKDMPLKTVERYAMGILALIMAAIELTLAWEKHSALFFASSVLCGGISMRFATKTYPKLSLLGKGYALVGAAALFVGGTVFVGVFRNPLSGMLATSLPLLHTANSTLILILVIAGLLLVFAGSCASTAMGYFRKAGLTVFRRAAPPQPAIEAPPAALIRGTPPEELEMDRPHVMVATRGGRPLLEFAATYAKDIRGILFVLFVRQLNVTFTGPAKPPTLDEDPEARAVLAMATAIAKKAGAPMIPIYTVSADIPYAILDFAATYNAKALLMGVSRKGALLRVLRGDILTAVADNLPADIPLLIHA